MKNEGARLLRMICLRGVSHDTIAAQLSVSRPAVTQWASSTTKPSRGKRTEIAKHYGIQADAWDTPEEKPGKASQVETTSVVAAPSPSRKSLESALEETLDELERTQIDDLTAQGRLQHLNIKSRLLHDLAKVRGDGLEMSEAKLLRLPAVRRIRDAIADEIVQCPQCAARVAARLRAMGGDS